jgi:hypothetical protein
LNESIDGQGGGAGGPVCPLGFPSLCVPCGGLSQLCCDGECDEGFDCEVPTEVVVTGQGSGAQLPPEPICIPCGALGQECCDNQTCGSNNLLCDGGLCEACGNLDEQCCPNNSCPNSGGVCIDDTCRPLPAAAALSRSGMIALILTLTAIGLLYMRPREGRA